MPSTLALLLALLVSIVTLSHGAVVCQDFSSLTVGTVYSAPAAVPGVTFITTSPLPITTQQYYDSFTEVVYGTTTVTLNTTAIPTGGSYLRLMKVNLALDFSAIQPKYVSFQFYDTTGHQNLRFNNSDLYFGTLVQAYPAVTPNATVTFATGDQNKVNTAQFFTHNQNQGIYSIWVGGDDFGINNICWDTVWHGSSASTLVVETVFVVVLAIMATLTQL